MISKDSNHTKYFKFVNSWVDIPHFMDTVQTCWDREVNCTGMWRFNHKQKRLPNTLSTWSKEEYGDIFQNVRMYEDQVHKAEEEYIIHPNDAKISALHEINAKYIKFLKMEDTILKQKTQLQWFKYGGTNAKYLKNVGILSRTI